MSEMLRNHMQEEIEKYSKPIERVRSPQEILARYNKALNTYKELSYSSDDDVYRQKLAVYAEIKILGWALGKQEKNVIKDIVANSNKMPFGTF
ncbi:MAG: hypothetical protein IKZ58_06040 [Selenomonadaceae bacterium]|nr:hypothetical protein [Selenomonadaceae bacterium]